MMKSCSRSRGVATGNRSTKNAFVSVEIHFNCWNPSAIEDLPCFDLRYHRCYCFLHVISLKTKTIRYHNCRKGTKEAKRNVR